MLILNDSVFLIGDPHLGRNFTNGTPLHRRGEREAMQRAQFQEELATPGVDTVVCVGDLFDKPFIPLPILSQTIADVVDAATARPDVSFIFMAGNHDVSRQLNVKGAWEIFELAVSWLENVEVLNEPKAIDGIMYYPWEWTRTALEQVQQYGSRSCHTAIGHWDLIDFGGDTSHMVPVEALLALNPNVDIYSGHYHEEGVFPVAGVNVQCTGSMQPYTHGEDPEGKLYVTLTVEEALARDDLYDKCVRIKLEPGEVMPDIDCLQLTRMRVDGEVEEVELDAVGAATFNVEENLNKHLDEQEVPQPVRIFIKEELGALD